MMRWAVAFFILTVLAAILAYGGVMTSAVLLAKLLFFVFAVLFMVTFILAYYEITEPKDME